MNEIIACMKMIVETDEVLARSACGMLIDMVCARYGGDPVEFAQTIANAVAQVNGTLGAYEEE